ncbi:hypothetical protein [Nocardioides alcanivorans]|uniref:hypothetical protein n=1 Tax=Nocardioides alcanivorans TaxID=2897352 RepID=UPI001F2A130E|nr:hypothetical protein [Nocardioides alcanivorans]
MSDQPMDPQQPPQQFPPPQGPPPQGPPYGPPPAGGGGNKRVAIAIVVVLVLLVAGGIAAAIALGGDDDDDSAGGAGSPVAAVAAAIDAIERGDCAAAAEHAPALDEAQCHALAPRGFSYGDVTEVEADDASATVEVTVQIEQTEQDVPVQVGLEREDGRWLIVDWSDAASLMGHAATDSGGSTDSGHSDDEGEGSGAGATRDIDPTQQEILEVADRFVTAIEQNDCDAARAIYLEPDEEDCADLELDDRSNTTFGESHGPIGDGQNATVMVDITVAGEEILQGFEITLVNDAARGWVVESWHARD